MKPWITSPVISTVRRKGAAPTMPRCQAEVFDRERGFDQCRSASVHGDWCAKHVKGAP